MTVKESIVRDILRLFIWYPVRWLFLVAPVGMGLVLLNAMGDLHCLLSREKKRMLRERVAHMRKRSWASRGGDEEAVREYFRNHYIDRLSIFLFPRLNRAEVDRLHEMSGVEHLDQALAKGNGVVLVHGHFGPVHFPLVALARFGYRMKQIGLPSDEGLSWIGKHVAFRLRMKYEALIPAEIIKADSFLRGAFKWLHSNGVVMITGDGSGMDQILGRHEVFDFFGQKMPFPLGPALLAGKTGAEILPLFIVPGDQKRYKIIIEKPLISQLSDKEAARDIARQFVERLEYHEARFPGFMHFLDRFHQADCCLEPDRNHASVPEPAGTDGLRG